VTSSLNRYKAAIIAVASESYPMRLSREEIIKKINEKNLLEISDEQFQEYLNYIKTSKKNEKGVV
jgi:hypothetical protein